MKGNLGNVIQQLLLFASLADKVFEGLILTADSHINRITKLQFTVTFSNAKPDQAQSQTDFEELADRSNIFSSLFFVSRTVVSCNCY